MMSQRITTMWNSDKSWLIYALQMVFMFVMLGVMSVVVPLLIQPYKTILAGVFIAVFVYGVFQTQP